MTDCNLKCNLRKCEEELFCQRYADYEQGILVGIDKCIKLYNEMKPSLATNVYEFGEKLKALKEQR